jgi:hypothetical protein
MPKVHALETGPNGTRVVIHVAVPVGNNVVAVSWQAAGLASGDLHPSVLPVGTGAGQTTQVELDAILAGTTAELEATVPVDSGGVTGAARIATLNAAVTGAVRDWTSTLKAKLNFFGYVQA